jgi:hypothetical protein
MAGAAGYGGGSSGAGGQAMLPPDGDIPAATALGKLDLLLVVDNSRNTAEKQRLLRDAVRWLLDADGAKLSVADIHVGVVTSSMGAHGAPAERDVCKAPKDDDHARLLASVRTGVASFQNQGFLAWGPDSEPDRSVLLSQLDPMLESASDQGCGYESTLEAWYRFLVQPDPPESVVLPSGSSQSEPQGIDQTLLQQRAAFLRPDSVLSIVVLSDENDCSVMDEGYGWLVSSVMARNMYRGTSACAQDPNDACCQSCGEAQANPGCPAIASDAACAQGDMLTLAEDSLNLRCWDQKRRYGFELLYPISRYQDGLTRQHVFDRDGTAVANPLFAAAGSKRHPSQVIFTGIVGVPWQDVATDASLSGTGLALLDGKGLAAAKRWDVMLGDPEASPPVLPSDPFMLETPLDRSTLPGAQPHPLVPSAALAPATSTNPQANPINGHESLIQRPDEPSPSNQVDDLQFACTFPLATPKLCDQAAFDNDVSCRCFIEDGVRNLALCQPPAGGAAGTTQYYDNAYPGLRHLQLLEALGDTALTASICPKVLTPADADYGYRPAMRALAARLEIALKP